MSDELESEAEWPAKFYKYRSMDERSAMWVERTIRHGEIYFPAAATFNDPFDLRPVFSLQAPRKVQKEDYIRLSKKYEPLLNRRERREEARRVMSGMMRKENLAKTAEDIQKAHTEVITQKVGVLCVSTKRDDILMWSHYGDSHRGVCLEFDGSSTFMAHAQKVIYASERRPINSYADTREEMMEKALLTKSEHWRYEAEWRVLRYQKGPGVVTFHPPSLTGVIIGAQASAATIGSIESWTRQSASPIKVYRASISNRTYDLNIVS